MQPRGTLPVLLLLSHVPTLAPVRSTRAQVRHTFPPTRGGNQGKGPCHCILVYVPRRSLSSPCTNEPRLGAYYAAQLGIALKLKDNVARKYLFDLLGVLESLKKEIGPNDAIDDESASSAYVENFAIRVFAGADNEDRRGNATRCAAQKAGFTSAERLIRHLFAQSHG